MTPLQSWLLLIAVFAILIVCIAVIFALIAATITIVSRWREARAYRRRFQAYINLDETTRKLIINSLYGKTAPRIANARRNGHKKGVGE